jgi:hypothetical protein
LPAFFLLVAQALARALFPKQIPKLKVKGDFMSKLSEIGRSAAARKIDRSAVTHNNDRASSCLFTFSDGRRCRTPRTGNHPHFCFDHAQKEARARATETIGKDLAYFFSGDYLSANDLSTALARILPAVVRGDIKPKTARTVAYLAQTLLQSIRLAQHEYIEALSTNGWRNAIANSVNGNRDYRFPSQPVPPQTQPPQPAPAPSPTSPTAAALNVAAGLQPGPHAQPAPPNPNPSPPHHRTTLNPLLSSRTQARLLRMGVRDLLLPPPPLQLHPPPPNLPHWPQA